MEVGSVLIGVGFTPTHADVEDIKHKFLHGAASVLIGVEGPTESDDYEKLAISIYVRLIRERKWDEPAGIIGCMGFSSLSGREMWIS